MFLLKVSTVYMCLNLLKRINLKFDKVDEKLSNRLTIAVILLFH